LSTLPSSPFKAIKVSALGACRFNHLSKRWETYTGKLATQVGSDRSFEEVAEERLGPALGEEAA